MIQMSFNFAAFIRYNSIVQALSSDSFTFLQNLNLNFIHFFLCYNIDNLMILASDFLSDLNSERLKHKCLNCTVSISVNLIKF